MPKFTYKCKDCKDIWSLFDEILPLICLKCKSINVNKCYSFIINSNNTDSKIEIGETTTKYIEENKLILEQMKQEKTEWNS